MKPTNYLEWRLVLHDAWKALGFLCDSEDKEHRFPRSIWKLRHRIKRIKARLEAEADAGTSSFLQALLEQVKSWKKRRS